jgi:hypothetical protein
LKKGTIHASGCHLFSEALSFYKPFCKVVVANLTSSDSLTFTNYSWADIFMKQLPDLLKFQFSRATNLSLLVFMRVSRISCSWCLEKQGGRKEGRTKKIDDYIHGIVNVFLHNHQGVLQRRYGQNSLNISIILYRNSANHSFLEHEMVLQTDCDGELHCCHDDCSLVLNQMPAPNVGWFALSP